MKRLLSLLFLAFLAGVSAQDNPDHWCRNGLFTQTGAAFTLAQVTPLVTRAYFFSDNETCPANDCQLSSYLIPGDTVILAEHFFADFVCAWYEPENGEETVGWLRQDDLELVAFAAEPTFDEWQGVWKDAENTLVINESFFGEGLIIEGQAFWIGLDDTIHTGGVFGKSFPTGNKLKLFDLDYDCELELWLLDSYLIAKDNKQCGGANVTFDGIYQH
ncbi:MAG: hypothetical protein KC422_11385 [Trueperaceae bacterium]|nr:hypothetical protein [Trueperaceae bacterium]